MFGRLYFGEVKKLLRPNALITLAVFFVIFFILFAVVYNLDIESILEDQTIEVPDENGVLEEVPLDDALSLTISATNSFVDVTADNIDDVLLQANLELIKCKEYDRQNKTNTAYKAKCEIAVLEYMKANNIAGKDMIVEGNAMYLGFNSTEGFVESYFSIVLTILCIYGIVIASGSLADEYKSGTIKLLMMRPVTRTQVLTAKLLSCFTAVLVILGVMSLLSYIYGVIAFKNMSSNTVYAVFNASSVFKSTAGGMLCLKMLWGTIRLLCLVTVGFTVGTLTRKKTVGIICGLIVMFGIVGSLFGMADLSIVAFSSNMDLSTYFLYGGAQERFANFYLSLGINIIYLAAILISTYVVTIKKDII